jgi:hypothetical protein
MSTSVPKARRSQEVPDLDSVRPVMAKAALPVTPDHTMLRAVIAGVIRSAGKLESTAGDMDIDRAQLYRQMENGHLTVENLEA